MSIWTRGLTVSAAFLAAAGIADRLPHRPTEMGACLQIAEPLSHPGAVGPPRRSRSAPMADMKSRCFRLPARQRETRSTRARPRHRGHHLHRYLVRGFDPQALSISGAPFMLRDFDHWKAYRDSKLFRDIAKGYEDKTKTKVIALTYYGERMVTAKQGDQEARGHEGHEAARAAGAAVSDGWRTSVGANATPIAFAEVYLALQQGTVDGQENPLPTIMAKKFYEVQSHVMLTGHIIESLLTIVARTSVKTVGRRQEGVRRGSGAGRREIFGSNSRVPEQKIADQLRQLGKTVVQVDREAFRKAAIPLHNDASAGAGWSQGKYDTLQALK